MLYHHREREADIDVVSGTGTWGCAPDPCWRVAAADQIVDW